MDNTSWTDLIFVVDTRNKITAEAIAAKCTSLGIYIEDYSDMEKMLPLIGRADYIDEKLASMDKTHVAIHIYIPEEEHPDDIITRMTELLASAGIDFALSTKSMQEDDWENDWKKFHKPQRINEKLVICPSWEDYKKNEGEVLLTIDPGSSFGSGGDETTRVCLRLMETNLEVGEIVLDMGCGCGVLSIAALLLGAKFALGVDIDKNAVTVAAENAQINGVNQNFEGRFGNVLTDSRFEESLGGGYDLICANIMADVHIDMKKIYFEKLKSGGKLILSGIIENRAEEVREVFGKLGFFFIGYEEENGWVALAFKK
ncbi:MAG: 50S ribosomal protein L11 methyltransferase [Oscillospiraceae bacterium]|nr:50S ribosomal protein L11 methyltransferase [Oscillospiraceae bacterium]